MNADVMLHHIQQAIQMGDYSLSTHAEEEREADQITRAEILEAFAGEHVELLEDYSADPRGHSMLVMGFTNAGLPIHAVFGVSGVQVLFITVYRPDPQKWYDWRRRVRQ